MQRQPELIWMVITSGVFVLAIKLSCWLLSYLEGRQAYYVEENASLYCVRHTYTFLLMKLTEKSVSNPVISTEKIIFKRRLL